MPQSYPKIADKNSGHTEKEREIIRDNVNKRQQKHHPGRISNELLGWVGLNQFYACTAIAQGSAVFCFVLFLIKFPGLTHQ